MNFALQPMGIDLFCLGKKFLVYNLVSRNLKVKYRRSILGVFWTLMAPIAMAVVYYVVFKVILRIDIPYYPVFVLAGVLPWTFFSQSVTEGMESLVLNLSLITKVPVPLQVFAYTTTLTNLITLLTAIPILIGTAVFMDAPIGPSMILLPVYYLLLFLITYSLGLLMAFGYVFFRDLKHLMGIVIQIWFYATPVIYDENMVPEGLRWALWLNPVALVITQSRAALVKGQWPDPLEALIPVAWALILLLAAAWAYGRHSRGLVEQL